MAVPEMPGQGRQELQPTKRLPRQQHRQQHAKACGRIGAKGNQPSEEPGNGLEIVNRNSGRNLEPCGTSMFVEDELDLMASTGQTLGEGKHHLLYAATVQVGQQQADASSRLRADSTAPCSNPFGYSCFGGGREG